MKKLKVREARKVFEKLGMKIREGRDTIASLYYEGRLVIRTKVPHKSGELKGKLPHYVRQQLRVNEIQFSGIKDCTIERDGYIRKLAEKGIV